MEIPEKVLLIKRTVLITGAGNGLGRAIANKFLTEGWQVIATDKDFPSLTDLKVNPNLVAIKMDVTSDEEVQAAFERIRTEDIQLDRIINNAGIDSYFPLSETPVGKFREVFETNVFGAYRVNQVFLPLLKKPGGRIIHIGSESLKITVPFMPYPITKNALERYAKVLRQELKFHGVDVVVIRPGAIRTELLKKVLNLKLAVSSWEMAVGSRQSAVDTEGKQSTEYDNESQLAIQMNKFAQIAPKNIGKISEPEEVAAFVYKVSQKPNPKVVYRINNNPLLKIMALLPFSLIEKAVRKQLSG